MLLFYKMLHHKVSSIAIALLWLPIAVLALLSWYLKEIQK